MIFGNKSISTYSRSNMSVWFVMAFQAGMLNIGGFMATHRFVSHVTGFAAFMGVDIANNSYIHAFGMLVVPFFFLLGTMISGQLVDVRLKLDLAPKYYFTFGIMFLLIFTVYIAGHFGFFGPFGEPLESTNDYTLLILLCLVCGIQNGTITTVSRSVVRTTHLTGITTDLGIGLVRLINRKKLNHSIESEEHKANFMRLGIIFSFAIGSVAAGISFEKYGYEAFLLPTLTSGSLYVLMLYYQVIKKNNTI